MAYDMGTAVGSVELDISDVNKKTAEINRDFQAIVNNSDSIVKSIERQAQVFDTVLGGAYDDAVQSLTSMQKANLSLNSLYDSNRQKVQMFANIVRETANVQSVAQEKMKRASQELNDAQTEVNRKLQEYNNLRNSGAHYDLTGKEREYIAALNREFKAKEEYNKALNDEALAVANATKAQENYQKVVSQVNAVEREAQTAMTNFATSDAVQMEQANRRRLEGINNIRVANQQEYSERKTQYADIRDAIGKEQDAEEKLSQNRVLAFAVAAKAVDEVVNGIKRLAQEMVNLSQQVINIGANFETSMAQVAATSGMSATDVKNRISEYEDLVAAAKEAGLTTIFSASEAGEALNYLALAGYNVEQSIETMPDILTIAAAGAMDLGRASDMVTDAMNALDLGIGNTNDFIDKMAKTAQSSNTNVEQLGNAILTVGGTATVLAGGVTELDTAIGLLANSGIKARVGGTALRQILLNLTAPSAAAKEKIEELGLQVFDTAGNLRPLNEIFKDLGDILEDFSDQQRMEALNAIFDARQVRSANALIQGAGEAWDNLYNKIENSTGAAEKMAETMRSNLNGALNIAKSNLDAIAITIYEGIGQNITDLVQEAIPKLQKLNETLASNEVQAKLSALSAEIKDFALNVLDGLIKVIPKIIDYIPSIDASLKGLILTITALQGLRVIAKIDGITKALSGVAAFIASNPYAAIAAAVALVTAAVLQYVSAMERAKEAAIAAAEEARDVWTGQRQEIQDIVDEWNDYKEQAEQVKTENKAQIDTIIDLYNEYDRLIKAEEDTTLALQALAEEVPEVNKMLEEGTATYSAITQAVDEYCKALEREAEVEMYKSDYSQAIRTRARIQDNIEELNQAMTDSARDANLAKIALDNYVSTYGEPIFYTGKVKSDYEKLEATYQAANNIAAANSKAWSDAVQTMDEANNQVEESRQKFQDALGKDIETEVDIIEDGSQQVVGTYATAGEAMKRANEKSKAQFEKQTQETADKIKAEVEKMDAKITIGEATEYDKIDLFRRYFGDRFDKSKFDIANKDIVGFYGDYQKLIQKKEKELQDELDKQQKERDKIAKDNAKALKESIEGSLSTIDWYAGLTGATAAEQAQQVRQFVNDNISYYKQYPEEYEKVVRKIVGLDKQWLSNTDLTAEELEKYLKDIEGFYKEYFGEDSEAYKALVSIVTDTQAQRNKELAEEYFKNWTDGYTKLADKATKAYADIQKSRESFEKNLLSGAELFSSETEKTWNRFTQQWEEKQGTVINKNAYKDAKKELVDLQTVMGNLKTKGLDEGILNELWGMKPEEALEKASELNKMSSGAIQKLNSDYRAYTEEAEKMSQQYYDQQISDWEEKYWSPLEQYVSEGSADLKNAMALVGEDTVNGFIDGLQSKVDSADEGTKQVMKDVLNTAKETLGIHSPSTVFYEVGENTIQGFLNGIQSKIESIATIFLSLGQKAGDSFVNAFKETWDNFVALMNTTGGLAMPQAMVATTYGTPAFAGGQMVYNGMPANYTGLTREDIISAVQEALPDGNVVLSINQKAFAEVSRDALNSLTDNGEMGLKV